MGSSSSTKQNTEMIKLKDILREISKEKDISPENSYTLNPPLIYRHYFDNGTVQIEYKWDFKNAAGKKNPNMRIEINLEYDTEFKHKKSKPAMVITFFKKGQSFDYKTGQRDFTKIYNSILKAADQMIKAELGNSATENDLYKIGYQPADEQRDRIYKIMIKRYYPQFEYSEDEKDIRSQYEWFVNINHPAAKKITQPPQNKTSSED